MRGVVEGWRVWDRWPAAWTAAVVGPEEVVVVAVGALVVMGRGVEVECG